MRIFIFQYFLGPPPKKSGQKGDFRYSFFYKILSTRKTYLKPNSNLNFPCAFIISIKKTRLLHLLPRFRSSLSAHHRFSSQALLSRYNFLSFFFLFCYQAVWNPQPLRHTYHVRAHCTRTLSTIHYTRATTAQGVGKN